MDKIKLTNNNTYELIINGISNTDNEVIIHILAKDYTVEDLEVEFAILDKLYLLSESDETLAVYSEGYKLHTISKIKNVSISSTVVDNELIETISDVMSIKLSKINETELRLMNLEESVDALAMELLLGIEEEL